MAQLSGWMGKILRIDLSTGKTSELNTMDYADRFLGGRGIATRIYWDEVAPDIDALSEKNCLIIMTGPLAGTPAPSGSRWIVCSKSPLTYPLEQFSYGNLGGFLAAELKSAGYDGIVITGKAERPVYLWVNDSKTELRSADHLWGKGADETIELLKSELGGGTRSVVTGPAGEHQVRLATLYTDTGGSASSGFGAVMGSKNLKAVAVRGSGKVAVALPEELTRVRDAIRALDRGLPYKDPIEWPEYERNAHCYGCLTGCERAIFKMPSGQRGIRKCQAKTYYWDWFKPNDLEQRETAFKATGLANYYGVDTYDLGAMLPWLKAAYDAGELSEGETGLPFSKYGSVEFVETMLKKMAYREGFGEILGHGCWRAYDQVGKGPKEALVDYLTTYGPRLYIITALFFATEPRIPIQHLHEISFLICKWVYGVKGDEFGAHLTSEVVRKVAQRFWGSEMAGDFSTYEGKALAATKIQDRQYAKESLILCDFFWPILDSKRTPDKVGYPGLEARLFSAVTGRQTEEEDLNTFGERAFNLQRAVLAREGHAGREKDVLDEVQFTKGIQYDYGNDECIVPGPQGEVFSRRGMVVDREQFEKMKDEYYRLRGWDEKTGLQTKEKLTALSLADIAEDLGRRRLLVS